MKVDKQKIKEWKLKVESSRTYSHFDRRTNINASCDKVFDPSYVKKHNFYPFIHSVIKNVKYNKKNLNKKIKERKIYYSAHLDRCIYQYYGFLINEHYNKYAQEKGFDRNSLAYRNNFKNGTTISFAYDAIEFIKHENCNIIVGDFTNFFDNLDHKYLKKMLCRVLETKNLTEDFYAVYKNITRYSYVEMKDILKLHNMDDNINNIQKINKLDTVLTLKQFHENLNKVKPNKKTYGIPQGSAISAVLSNVYMIEADERLKRLADKVNGKYLRYSDDFIFIFPSTESNFKECYDEVVEIISNIPNLELQPEKTETYQFECSDIFEYNIETNNIGEHSRLDYLGFSFDGKKVSLREKTISKYYYKMNRSVKKKSPSVTYKKYSVKGLKENTKVKQIDITQSVQKKKNYGNFISYVNRSLKIFGESENVILVKKRHLNKIGRAYKKKREERRITSELSYEMKGLISRVKQKSFSQKFKLVESLLRITRESQLELFKELRSNAIAIDEDKIYLRDIIADEICYDRKRKPIHVIFHIIPQESIEINESYLCKILSDIIFDSECELGFYILLNSNLYIMDVRQYNLKDNNESSDI